MTHPWVDREVASTPARVYAVAESPSTGERREVVLVALHDARGRHSRSQVLDGRIVRHLRPRSEQPLEVAIRADVDRGRPEDERVGATHAIGTFRDSAPDGGREGRKVTAGGDTIGRDVRAHDVQRG